MGRNYRYVGARGGAGAGAVSGGFPPRSLTSRWSWEFGGRGLLGPGSPAHFPNGDVVGVAPWPPLPPSYTASAVAEMYHVRRGR